MAGAYASLAAACAQNAAAAHAALRSALALGAAPAGGSCSGAASGVLTAAADAVARTAAREAAAAAQRASRSVGHAGEAAGDAAQTHRALALHVAGRGRAPPVEAPLDAPLEPPTQASPDKGLSSYSATGDSATPPSSPSTSPPSPPTPTASPLTPSPLASALDAAYAAQQLDAASEAVRRQLSLSYGRRVVGGGGRGVDEQGPVPAGAAEGGGADAATKVTPAAPLGVSDLALSLALLSQVDGDELPKAHGKLHTALPTDGGSEVALFKEGTPGVAGGGVGAGSADAPAAVPAEWLSRPVSEKRAALAEMAARARDRLTTKHSAVASTLTPPESEDQEGEEGEEGPMGSRNAKVAPEQQQGQEGPKGGAAAKGGDAPDGGFDVQVTGSSGETFSILRGAADPRWAGARRHRERTPMQLGAWRDTRGAGPNGTPPGPLSNGRTGAGKGWQPKAAAAVAGGPRGPGAGGSRNRAPAANLLSQASDELLAEAERRLGVGVGMGGAAGVGASAVGRAEAPEVLRTLEGTESTME